MFKKIFVGLLLMVVMSGKALAQNVDYYLPYPGILPDHPLYWLKMVRDRIILITVVNPDAKAEKLLLYADKRLGAAWALIDGNKQTLGVSTLTKAEKYLEQAVTINTNTAFKDRLNKAIVKHEEVVKIIKPKLETAHMPLVEEILVKLNQFKPGMPAEAPVTEIKIEAPAAGTALSVLTTEAEVKNWELVTKEYKFGTMVEAIAGAANNQENAWIFYVNGKAGDKASDQLKVKAGDLVEWKYEAVKL